MPDPQRYLATVRAVVTVDVPVLADDFVRAHHAQINRADVADALRAGGFKIRADQEPFLVLTVCKHEPKPEEVNNAPAL